MKNGLCSQTRKSASRNSSNLLPEHTDLIREIRGPRGLPDLYFFRHVTAWSGVAAGVRFGQKQFRKWWNQACEKLGIGACLSALTLCNL
jgi:hypothetical protein